MNLNKQRAAVIAAALAAVIGGGAAMQALASEPAHTVRLIDPASLVLALGGDAVAPESFASDLSYASSFAAAPAVTGASFANEAAVAQVFNLASIAAAVQQPAAVETFSAATTYADSLRAADLSGGASFQLAGSGATGALFDLEGVAAAFADDASAEQAQFADETSYASGLRDAYLESGFGGETFSGVVPAEAPSLDLAAVAAAADGAEAPTATFADQSGYAGSLSAAYLPAGFSDSTFSNEVSAAPVINLAGAADANAAPVTDLAGAAADTSFSEVSSYAGSLRAADLGSAGASFSGELAAPVDLFDLGALGESLSDGE